MTLDYETCLALKEAGFPQGGDGPHWHCSFTRPKPEDFWLGLNGDGPLSENDAYVPTLSELIDGFGDVYFKLTHAEGEWEAIAPHKTIRRLETGKGATPEAAVAALYLATHGKGNV